MQVPMQVHAFLVVRPSMGRMHICNPSGCAPVAVRIISESASPAHASLERVENVWSSLQDIQILSIAH